MLAKRLSSERSLRLLTFMLVLECGSIVGQGSRIVADQSSREIGGDADAYMRSFSGTCVARSQLPCEHT
jgi:hypothetical protein